ncbi:MAG TPA: hypothetical protein VFP97_10440 [Chitinophagaceae bacterium]|nr:hypothetical protein [Chitinophagaceae bacterium]
MKKLIFLFACVFLFQLVWAQTKELSACRHLRDSLAKINNSFDRLIEKFATTEDKISLIKTYFTNISICEETGKIKDYGRNIQLVFSFSDADYLGGRHEFRDFYKKVFKKIKGEFATSHVYRVTKEKSGKASYFYEKEKEISSSKSNIKLSLAYKDPVDESTAYSLTLIFEYYPKR